MRLSRVVPSSADEIRSLALGDLDALLEGLRVVAGRLPIPGHEPIDLLAADDRGRMVLVDFCLQADAGDVARAVGRWNWLAANLPVLAILAGSGAQSATTGLDPSSEPRLMIVSAGITPAAARLAACLKRPEIELLVATIVQAADARGLLVEQAAPAPPPPAPKETGIDPILSGLPAGRSRSFARRLLEELSGRLVDGGAVSATPVQGAIDLTCGDRLIASIVADGEALRVRRTAVSAILSVTDDAGCREAAEFLTGCRTAGEVRAGPPAEEDPLPPGQARPEAVLTPEEIAEFERLSGRSPGHAGFQDKGGLAEPGGHAGADDTARFVEN